MYATTLSTALVQSHSHSLSIVGNTYVNFRACVYHLPHALSDLHKFHYGDFPSSAPNVELSVL